jgi:hypothetical protein
LLSAPHIPPQLTTIMSVTATMQIYRNTDNFVGEHKQLNNYCNTIMLWIHLWKKYTDDDQRKEFLRIERIKVCVS